MTITITVTIPVTIPLTIAITLTLTITLPFIISCLRQLDAKQKQTWQIHVRLSPVWGLQSFPRSPQSIRRFINNVTVQIKDVQAGATRAGWGFPILIAQPPKGML